MPWLLRDGAVLCSLEVADDVRTRSRGLMGRDTFDGAILLKPAMQVHTLGMRFPIDVIFADRDGRITRCVPHVRPWRITGALRAFAAIELAAGTIARTGTRRFSRVELRAAAPAAVDGRPGAAALEG